VLLCNEEVYVGAIPCKFPEKQGFAESLGLWTGTTAIQSDRRELFSGPAERLPFYRLFLGISSPANCALPVFGE
jgi:hypothetical protein